MRGRHDATSPQARRRCAPARPALAALALILSAMPVAAQEAPRLVPYVVEAGESCWSIAGRLFGDPTRYDILHRYNDLGPMPHLLVPGQVLMVPAEGTDPDARVGTPFREVLARSPEAIDSRVRIGHSRPPIQVALPGVATQYSTSGLAKAE